VDQQTRGRHASQELAVLFGVLLAEAVALLVWAVASRDWEQVAVGGLLCVSTGINFSAQLRGLRSAEPAVRQDVTPAPDSPGQG